MTLTTYDETKQCQVLNPAAFVINAFHPDYVKTYMPEFLSGIRDESTQKENGKKGAKVSPMKMYPIRAAHLHRPNLTPTEFHIFNKAGMPKGVKK